MSDALLLSPTRIPQLPASLTTVTSVAIDLKWTAFPVWLSASTLPSMR